MRIFITGGSGFLGRPLVKQLLANGHTLAMLSRQSTTDLPVRVIQGDLGKISEWERQFLTFDPELVYHLSWEGLPDYSLAMCVKNLQHGANLYQLIGTTGCKKVVSTGTCWEYGDCKGQVTARDEGGRLNLFAAAKQSLRLIGESLFRDTAVSFLWARIFFAYGEGQRKTSLLPTLVHSILHGQAPSIRNPQAMNDFIYVDDIAAALASLATLHDSGPLPQVVNIGTGIPHAVSEVQALVQSMMNNSQDCRHETIHSAADGVWCDPGELTGLTGWRPAFDLASGIRVTLQRMGVHS